MTSAPGAARPGPPAHRPWWRRAGDVGWLPILALAFLLAGGVARLSSGSPAAGRVWFAGLVLAGAPAVLQTVRGMLRGHFASDIVAMLAIVTAIVLGEPLAGLVVVLMQTGGQALERYAEGRASAAVRALEEASPRLAHRIGADGHVMDVPADAVAIGEHLLLRPGDLVPCDVEVVSGRSHVDTSRLSGEPMPELAEEHTRIASGSANIEGALRVRVIALARESQYARIVELVRSAQASKAPLQRLADRYAIWFTPITLVVCALAWLASHDAGRVLAVLVVATPCPLILATPVAIIGGINRAAARQIVVRTGGALEQLAAVTVAVFDKTGTVTLGRPDVSRIHVATPWTERELLRLAGAVEQGSGHLLARSVVDAAVATLDEPLPHPDRVAEVAGRGVRGRVDGHDVVVGARRFVAEELAHGGDAQVAAMDALDACFWGTEGLRAYVAVDGRIAGMLEFADNIRDDARPMMEALESLGLGRSVLLSGDNAANVAAVAGTLAFTESRGDLLPADKVTTVRGIVAEGERVLMVGDGTNDAPALSSATVGVALAGSIGHGGGITAEAADVVILADSLERIPEAIRIGRRTMQVARQSLVAGLGLSAVAMVFAALGHVQPVAGALLQEAIDVAVIVNALRASR